MDGTRILIVEDEYLVAIELAENFRSIGARVLGPFRTIDEAMGYVDAADGAVLDINLDGLAVFPLADALLRRGIPFVFFSGQDEIHLPSRFRFAPNLTKPSSFAKVAEPLLGDPPDEADTTDIPALLPRLRLAARLRLGDSEAADRLVERTLQAAISDCSDSKCLPTVAMWLSNLMDGVLASEGREVLN